MAVGGRFDKLMTNLASNLHVEDKNFKCPSGIGVSLGLETLAARIRDEDLMSRLDVVLHGSSSSKLELAHQLWVKGVRCSLADPGWGVDEVQNFACEAGAGVIVIFQESGAYVRLLELQNERFTERKVAKHELLSVLNKVLESTEVASNLGGGGGLSRMDSSSRVLESQSSQSTTPQINIDFQYYPDKKNNTLKKHLESRINEKLMLNTSSPLAALTSNTFVQVLVLPFSGSVIRSMVKNFIFKKKSPQLVEFYRWPSWTLRPRRANSIRA